ncbi:unnamed protein product [Heligmosomoides polygyrus]|uniref:DDE_Tnp_1_7 domain-containing protein n=1 Tax=Heligmosomoides polygyrus TaxID=6339 RepID=A0A183G7K1_HELPZ|nr:unnamed protein product [Heligmosomoides polygyrus]
METKMLRWTAGVTRMDRIRNDAIRQKFGVAPIAIKMREARLRWYGHVLRGKEDSVRKIGLELKVSGKRPRGRPKQRMKAVLRVAVQVVLCIGAMAFVELDGCQRMPIDMETAKNNSELRAEIKQYLKLTLNDKAVTFIYGSPDYGQNELIRIPFSKYFQYLECAVHAVEENSES